MTTPEDSSKRAASSITMPEGTQTEAFYNKSEFLRIEDVARDFYAPDLHNNIGPMYHEKNFAHDIEYKYIEMSARLATRYLQTAETWSAIDKIVNTRQKGLTNLEEKKPRPEPLRISISVEADVGRAPRRCEERTRSCRRDG